MKAVVAFVLTWALLPPTTDASATLTASSARTTTALTAFPHFERGADASAASFGVNRTNGSVTVPSTNAQTTYATVVWLNATGASALWTNLSLRAPPTGSLSNLKSLEVDLVTAGGSTTALLAANGVFTKSGGATVQIAAGAWMRVQVIEKFTGTGATVSLPVSLRAYDNAGGTRGGTLTLTLVV